MQRTREEIQDVLRRIFAETDRICQEERDKTKRKELRKRFKGFKTMQVYDVRSAKQNHKLKLIDKFYK